MKRNYSKLSAIISCAIMLTTMAFAGFSLFKVQPVRAEDPPADTPTPTNTFTPTDTPVPSATPVPFGRPLVVIDGYSGPGKSIAPGKTFDVTINLSNHGLVQASNIVISFTSGDFIARSTGGVQAISFLNSGQASSISQQLTASDSVLGKTVAYMTVNISYTDTLGAVFTSDTSLAFNIKSVEATAESGGYYSPSATPTSSKRPQLIISNYLTDLDPLQPGSSFTLSLNIANVGSTNARNITMVMGGGSSSSGGGESGTAVPGGVSGSSGEFTNFAPIGSSNVQTLGNVGTAENKQAMQKLIVNVSTNPGTYPVKFSFVYTDESGKSWQDDQVITLLVYRLPILDVNFYRPPDIFSAGMPGVLPIQVVNLSRNSTILGSMKVTTTAGTLTNDTMLIGPLDAGGYFPLDVNFTPDAEGKAEIDVTIQFTDDFNSPREVTSKFFVDVAPAMDLSGPGLDGMGGGGGGGGGFVEPQPETTWQKVVRFIKGLFGLDSGVPDVPVDQSQPELPPVKVNPAPMKGG
jgi:hypothetical protein